MDSVIEDITGDQCSVATSVPSLPWLNQKEECTRMWRTICDQTESPVWIARRVVSRRTRERTVINERSVSCETLSVTFLVFCSCFDITVYYAVYILFLI